MFRDTTQTTCSYISCHEVMSYILVHIVGDALAVV